MEGRGRGRGNANQRGGRGGGNKSWPGNQNNTPSPQQRLGVNFNATPTLGFNQAGQNQQSFNNGQNNQKNNQQTTSNTSTGMPITQVKSRLSMPQDPMKVFI